MYLLLVKKEALQLVSHYNISHTLYNTQSCIITLVGDDYMMVDLTPSISSDYSFTVTINEDDDIELDELFTLTLATVEDGVSISQSTTVITITDTSELLLYYTVV